MISNKNLIKCFTSEIEGIEGVDSLELDGFINKNGVILRCEHKEFILNFGNSNLILKYSFADFSFDNFRRYYLEDNQFYSDVIPEGTVYIGHDYCDESLCVDNLTGHIYIYDSAEKDLLLYDSIDSLLFNNLLVYSANFNIFDNIEYNVEFSEFDSYLERKIILKIDGIGIRDSLFYGGKGILIELNTKNNKFNIFRGNWLSFI